jgi:hypothetical protein
VDNPATTHSLPLQLASDLPATSEAAESSGRSPLFYLIRSNISVAFVIVQLARKSLKPGSEQAFVKAEEVYAKNMRYVEHLPEDERGPTLLDLGRLRTALDEFRSAQNDIE